MRSDGRRPRSTKILDVTDEHPERSARLLRDHSSRASRSALDACMAKRDAVPDGPHAAGEPAGGRRPGA
jgi:hypothetical protein